MNRVGPDLIFLSGCRISAACRIRPDMPDNRPDNPAKFKMRPDNPAKFKIRPDNPALPDIRPNPSYEYLMHLE